MENEPHKILAEILTHIKSQYPGINCIITIWPEDATDLALSVSSVPPSIMKPVLSRALELLEKKKNILHAKTYEFLIEKKKPTIN